MPGLQVGRIDEDPTHRRSAMVLWLITRILTSHILQFFSGSL